MKTKHPLPEAIYLAVEAVESSIKPFIKNDEKQFSMLEGSVNDLGHTCGTVHCAGGWFAVALSDLSKSIDFMDGAIDFASCLGFDYLDDMEWWADRNKGLWGNNFGYHMFTGNFAYIDDGIDESKTMQDVLNHWRRVAQRIEQYNADCI